MPSIVFVHGIGVRDDGYPAVWPHLDGRLREMRPDRPIGFCFWGGDHGARLGPPAGLTGEAEPDLQAELWAASFADPWWELATLAEKAAQEPVTPLPPHLPRSGPVLRDRVLALGAATIPAASGLDRHLAAAVGDLLGSVVAKECFGRADTIGTELPAALARALVVLTVERAEADGPIVLPRHALDDFEAILITELGGRPMAIVPSWMRRLAGRLVRPYVEAGLRPISWAMAAGRGPLTRGVTPYLGDVMVYLARGDAIRDKIVASVTTQPGPVDLIAHSLGGIACFDLLAQGLLPQVRSLTTVGTQVSYLYRIGALPGLDRDVPVPPLPRWVNVVDRHDALSFPAEPWFPGAVTDHRLDSGLPFPLAHSAYFRNDAFYDLLDEVLA